MVRSQHWVLHHAQFLTDMSKNSLSEILGISNEFYD